MFWLILCLLVIAASLILIVRYRKTIREKDDTIERQKKLIDALTVQEPALPIGKCKPSNTKLKKKFFKMATNQLTLSFTPCSPAPVGGYIIKYRPVGDVGPFRDAPGNPYMSSPAVWNDTLDPEDTEYEATIQSDCGDGNLGEPVEVESHPEIEYNVILENGFDQDGNQITDLSGFSYTDADESFPLAGNTTMQAVHGGFNTAITVSVVKPVGVANASVKLFKNNILQECIDVPATGGYTFGAVTFAPGDECKVTYFDTAC